MFYSLLKSKTGEFHLFGSQEENNLRQMSERSFCNDMGKQDHVNSGYDFFTQEELQARMYIAILGRKVCAKCIQELYRTEN